MYAPYISPSDETFVAHVLTPSSVVRSTSTNCARLNNGSLLVIFRTKHPVIVFTSRTFVILVSEAVVPATNADLCSGSRVLSTLLPVHREQIEMASTGFDQLKAFWYFFGGIIVFGFYITNLFVGVMFEAFLSYKNMDSKGSLISQAERRWRDYEKRLCQVRPLAGSFRLGHKPPPSRASTPPPVLRVLPYTVKFRLPVKANFHSSVCPDVAK